MVGSDPYLCIIKMIRGDSISARKTPSMKGPSLICYCYENWQRQLVVCMDSTLVELLVQNCKHSVAMKIENEMQNSRLSSANTVEGDTVDVEV